VYAQKVLLAIAAAAIYQAPGRQIVSLDDDWKFALGHASDASKDFNYGLDSFGTFAKAGIEDGAMGRGFGDTAWRTVQVPHDWCVELPFDQKGDLMHGFKAIGRRFPENSIGWYRKSFELPKEDAGKRFVLKFDGIFRDAQVWVNGQYIIRNTSGYMGFHVDVTKVLEAGARNVIAVRVDASVYEGWFYEGAGIYRHVWLNKTNHDYLVEDEQFIKPEVNGSVTAEITTQTTKARTAKLQITDKEGKLVAESPVTKLKGDKNTLKLKVAKPKLWSPDEPNLYRAHVLLLDGQTVLDKYETNIGFKSVVFDPDKGLFINGKYTEIKGVCNHQDHAGVGAAVPDRLNEWRIERLKEMGCNALRTSHNPPTPELLDACDKLGILVQDENRLFSAGPEGLSQMERLVKRDRNHASVFMWSLGNEEWGVQTSKAGEQISQALYDLTKKLDPTRTITQGVNVGNTWEGSNKVVDNRGFNYNLGGADGYHKDHPKQPIHGSEVASMLSTWTRMTTRKLIGVRAPKSGGSGSSSALGSLAASCGPASTTEVSQPRTTGQLSVATSESWTPAASPKTCFTTTNPGGATNPSSTSSPTGTGLGRKAKRLTSGSSAILKPSS
jgi:beta-galactosidase